MACTIAQPATLLEPPGSCYRYSVAFEHAMEITLVSLVRTKDKDSLGPSTADREATMDRLLGICHCVWSLHGDQLRYAAVESGA